MTDTRRSGAPEGGAAKPISVADMVETVEEEAYRIEGVQRALVAAGDREVVHPGQMWKASVFWEIARLLRIWQANEPELRRAIKRLPGRG